MMTPEEREAVDTMMAECVKDYDATPADVRLWTLNVYIPYALTIPELRHMPLAEMLSVATQVECFLTDNGRLPHNGQELDQYSE